MRFHEFKHTALINLQEGVGLARRKPGELFKNATGDELTFQNLEFFPPTGRFEPTELTQQLSNFNDVTWTNDLKKTTGAFGIARFTNKEGGEIILGRYFNSIAANRNDNDFPHKAIPDGYKYNSKEGAKENAGYKPSQVLSRLEELTPEDIAQQITEHFGEGSDESNAAQIFLSAPSFPVVVPKGSMNAEAFRIYFCEMLQPMALMKGMDIGGNYQEAVSRFLGEDASLSDCTAKFNGTTGGGLSDSVLVSSSGAELRISTKSGSGAKASAQNLLKAIDELKSTDDGLALLEKHPIVMPILEAFKGNMKKDGSGYDGRTHFSAPLDIAMLGNLITDKEANQVMLLKEGNFGLGFDPIGQRILSKKLEKWYSDYLSKWSKPVVPIHTLMLIIAYKACQWVNKETDFNKAASKVLNHSALVQVYSTVKESRDSFVIEGMNAIYPSKAVTGVTLTTEKAYWTTGAQGNMTFNIEYNGGIDGKSVNPVAAKLTSPTVSDAPFTTQKQEQEPQQEPEQELEQEPQQELEQEPQQQELQLEPQQEPVADQAVTTTPETADETEDDVTRLKKNAGINI